MNDNVRSKNLQITELNRKLKQLTENSQKQAKLLNKKNVDLQKAMKQLEAENKQLKEQKQAEEANGPDADTEQEKVKPKKKNQNRQKSPSKAKAKGSPSKQKEEIVEVSKEDGDVEVKDDDSDHYSEDVIKDDVSTIQKSSRILSAQKPPVIDNDEDMSGGGYTSVDEDPIAEEG